ncbi:PKD domain-containing protein [Microbacterium foliorum]|uniref:PKD domain-containing protein n=1 Tax=Microbacterium foliorum TaxID=104336 RepID=UPI001D6B9D86|nr:PKD domain-containing protein [Microbacterium foliorum]CAH0191999.1 Protease 1 [Microbacterium foliorum]CAH0224665.1 Protease 1 [Microbacterium foliorum]
MSIQVVSRRSPRWRAAFAAIIGVVLVFSAALVAPVAASAAVPAAKAPFLQRTADVATADALPTVQIDSGYVWAQTTVGNTVYAAGSFSNARAALAAPGTSLTPRSNILAYDIATGNLLPFAPTVNGVIKSIARSNDGSRIYIGGSFTQVNGTARFNFAALDAQTGQLIAGFAPSVGGVGVFGITLLGDSVYVAGNFTQANGTARKNFAAFATSNGALRSWAPTSDLQVDALVTDPDGSQVIAGGRFSMVNGLATQRGLSAIDPVSGIVNTGWQANSTVMNGATSGKAGIFALSTDATGVYGTGWVFADVATGNLEGVFAADAGSGAIRWVADCHGDHYGVYSTGKVVYATSHTHQCETVSLWPEQSVRQYRYMEAFTTTAEGTLSRSASVGSIYKDWSGTPSPSAYAWYPDFTVGTASGLGQAGLSITGAGDYISVAGEFTSVNGQRYQGIVRFSTTPSGGAKQGPRLTGASWSAPTATTASPGRVRVSIPVNWDRDDRDLTYQLLRTGTAGVIDQKVVSSGWWSTAQASLTDKTVTPGATYTYTVRAVDGNGNATTSQPVTATATSGVTSDYANAVLDDGAQLYYPLGSTTTNWAGGASPSYGSGVSVASPGAVEGATGTTASKLDGTTSGLISSGAAVSGPTDFSAETWFKTTTDNGGKIFGFGDQQTSFSGSYDRHLYMQNNGRLTFGVYPGAVRTVSSTTSYNDGRWHHAVASLSSAGMELYVDGVLVAQDASVTDAQGYNGYWRVGGDSLGGWPDGPARWEFDGTVDEFAVYPSALSAAQVATHYALGAGIHAPTAAFDATPTNLTVAFDATASTVDAGQTLTGYSWDFGDGHTGTGATPTHVYSASGTYDVVLNVTDSRGLTGTVSHPVTVTGPNALPTADFTSTASGLTASVNGTTSVDSDGTIAAYSWNWGDGSAAGTGATATHAYAAPGTYAVTLTVTDDRGGQATKTANVIVTHAAPVASFTATANALTVSVDGAASTASDAATLAYSWNWGDGSPAGSGGTASHVYATAGDFTITLTLTDSVGATATATRAVTVADQAFAIRDDFERTTASGWGSAELGGAYTVMNGAASAASVSGGAAKLTLAAGQTRNVALQSTSLADTLTTLMYSSDQGPATGGSYVGVSSRKSASSEYLTRVWMRNDGKLWLVIQRDSTVLVSKALTTTWAAGDVFRLSVKVSGASPTTIQAKTWKDGTAEPADWQLSTTDATASLQGSGWTSVHANRAGSATSTAVFSFDSLRVTDLKAPVGPVPNVAPTAAFTSTVTNLGVAVDGSTSSDSDGTVVGHSWNWGDGTPAGTGAAATHTYAAAGTYTVTLTVTDDDGATGTATRQVVATSPPVEPQPGAVVASDDFARTATGGWSTAGVGGAWTLAGGAASAASVADGTGVLTLAAGSTRNMLLNSVSAKNVTMSMDFSADAAPSTGQAYVGLIARSSATDNYLVRAWLNANGTVSIVTQQGSAVLSTYVVPGVTRGAGDAFTLKVDVAGGASTTISAKLWKQGTAEPAAWQTSFVDTTGIDAAGAVGAHANRTSSATGPVVVKVDNFRVTDNG